MFQQLAAPQRIPPQIENERITLILIQLLPLILIEF